MKNLVPCLVVAIFLFLSCKKESENNNLEKESVVEKADLMTGVDFKFTAYKTAKKLAVDGKFTDYKIEGAGEGTNLQEKLAGALVRIKTQSVDTGDDARNNTIRTKFFTEIVGEEILVKVIEFKGNKADIEIDLNGVKTIKEFDFYPRTGNPNAGTLEATIDMLEDFKANTAFNSIAEACKVLHEGKTWTDVKLTVNLDL